MPVGNTIPLETRQTSVSEPEAAFPNRHIRVVLAAVLGGMILLMLAAGIRAVRVLREIREQSDRIQADALARSTRLASIRNKLLLSDTFVRDYLFDPDEERIAEHRSDLRRLWDDLIPELDLFAMTGDGSEDPMSAELRDEMGAYWERIRPSLTWSVRERQAGGLAFYSSTVLPSRIMLLEITTHMDDAHQAQVTDSESRMAEGFEKMRGELSLTLVLSMMAAIILAIGSAIYILRLEKETRLRYDQVVAGRAEMERLSQSLVTAQEQERKAISRELHDEVGQTLNALLIDVGNLQKRMPEGDTHGHEILNSIRGLADTSVNEIRNIALLLRPSMLDDLGLTAAIEWQAREVSRRTGLPIKVSAGVVADQLPESLRICLYRIAQEALQNAAMHSHATTVHVDLRQDGDRLLLGVGDDGMGFDTEKVHGLGLTGMRERARQTGGVLRITSQPGKGTTVIAEVPVQPSQSSEPAS